MASGSTGGGATGSRSGRGLKPNLAAVYSARQQRSTNHSRQSSPGGLGGRLLLDAGLFTSSSSTLPVSPRTELPAVLMHSATTSPTGAAAARAYGLGSSNLGLDFRDPRGRGDQRGSAKAPRQCSPDSCASLSAASQDSSDSVELRGFAPAPPQSLPPNRSGGSLHGQRRIFALPGVTEAKSALFSPPPVEDHDLVVLPLQRLEPQLENHSFLTERLEAAPESMQSPRQAWDFIPGSRSSRSSASEPCEKPYHSHSRDGSVTPTPMIVPPSPSRLSFKSCTLAVSFPDPFGGGGYISPRMSSKSAQKGGATEVPVAEIRPEKGSFQSKLFAEACARSLGRAIESTHTNCKVAAKVDEQRVHEMEAVAELGEEGASPTHTLAEDLEDRLPQLREGWQLSLCQHVVLRCPAKLPSKDVFAIRKVPRPVSLEGSVRSSNSGSMSNLDECRSPCSPALPPLSSSGPVSPRRAGRRFQKEKGDEAMTPETGNDLTDVRLQMLMQEQAQRLSFSGMAPPDDIALRPSADLDTFTRQISGTSTACDDDAERLWEVKQEIVRGLAAASNCRRRSAPEYLTTRRQMGSF